MNRWVLLTLLLLIAPMARGSIGPEDPAFETTARKGIAHVYDLQFEDAEQDFGELIRKQPGHPAGYFFLAMVDWWRILIDLEDESRDQRFFDALDRVVDMCDSMLERNGDDVTAIFFKGGALGFQGRLKFHRNDYLAAANAGRKALPLVQTAFSLDPHNYDILLGTGIYNYYADVIPTEYPLVKPLLLFVPSGDKKKGIEQLIQAAEKGTFASTEAAYFLMQIYFFYERDYDKALSLALNLTGKYPHNMVFQRYLGRSYAAMSNWAMSDQVFSDIVARCRKQVRGFTLQVEREAEYYLGLSVMTTARLDDALSHFYRCDELSRGLDRTEPSGFMVMANLKIGNIYDLQRRRDLALVQYNKVLNMKEYKESASLSRQYIKTPYSR
jgi:tetratricopeptide (TPR) repeat protein